MRSERLLNLLLREGFGANRRNEAKSADYHMHSHIVLNVPLC